MRPMRANEGQAEAWNGPEAAHFVDHADRYDRQLEPFTQALLERAGPDPGRSLMHRLTTSPPARSMFSSAGLA